MFRVCHLTADRQSQLKLSYPSRTLGQEAGQLFSKEHGISGRGVGEAHGMTTDQTPNENHQSRD